MHFPPASCFNQATLKVRGKALSAEQKGKVVSKTQTENPLYLKILLEVNAFLQHHLYFWLLESSVAI